MTAISGGCDDVLDVEALRYMNDYVGAVASWFL